MEKSRGGYVLLFHKTQTGYSASVPDLPGCIATGRTLPIMKRRMDEAIVLHQRGMRQDGTRVQRPRSVAELRRRRLICASGPTSKKGE